MVACSRDVELMVGGNPCINLFLLILFVSYVLFCKLYLVAELTCAGKRGDRFEDKYLQEYVKSTINANTLCLLTTLDNTN